MTTPPFDPSSGRPGSAGGPTGPEPNLSAPAYRPPLPYGSGTAAQPAGGSPGSQAQWGPTSEPGRGYAPGPFQPAPPELAPVIVRPQPVKRSAGSSRALNLALGVAVLIAAAGVAFGVGRATAPVSASTVGRFGAGLGPNASFDANGDGGFRGNGYFPGGRAGLGFGGFGAGLTIQGTVESVAADSMTIKTANGTTITVGLGSSTTYHQQAAGSASDVQSGKTVILQVTGGFRANGTGGASGNAGNGSAGSGSVTLGTASDVTVVP